MENSTANKDQLDDMLPCKFWQEALDEHGWIMRKPTKVSPKVFYPILPSMFLDAMNYSQSRFYAYSNGDILFDKSLIETLAYLHKAVGSQKNILAVGQRINYAAKPRQSIKSIEKINKISKNGMYYTHFGMDYFITMADGYPWADVPDIIVGTIRYDNWILVHGLEESQVVIDITPTTTCVHQTGNDGNKASFNTEATNYNSDNIFGKFEFLLGTVRCGTLILTSEYKLINRYTSCKKQLPTCSNFYKYHCLRRLDKFNMTPADLSSDDFYSD